MGMEGCSDPLPWWRSGTQTLTHQTQLGVCYPEHFKLTLPEWTSAFYQSRRRGSGFGPGTLRRAQMDLLIESAENSRRSPPSLLSKTS